MQNVLTALNMILESRERRERADVQASLSGMELFLREQEMESLALNRRELREIEKKKMEQLEDKNFREKLTQIQSQQVLNLAKGSESMWSSMFNTLWLSNTAGGETVQESNIEGIIDDLTGTNYGFQDAEAKRLANYIVSYGLGVKSGSPNDMAMVSAANFLLEEAQNPASDSFKAMVKSGMMPDPNKNPQHTKAWLETMQGMEITNNNLITIQKDWADLTDNDPKNDYEFRPLDTVWDYRTGKYSGDKYGSALGEAGKQLSVQLEQLDAERVMIEEWKDKRNKILNDKSLNRKQRDEKLDALKYIGEEIKDLKGKGTGKYSKSDYQTIMGAYGAGKNQFGLGYQDYTDSDLDVPTGATGYKESGLYLSPSDYATLDPDDAIDYIAGKRDILMKEQKDATDAISRMEKEVKNVMSRGNPADMSVPVRAKFTQNRNQLFIERQRLGEINKAINEFYLQADIETEKHIDAGVWGEAGDEARRFRSHQEFPTGLLTESERRRRESPAGNRYSPTGESRDLDYIMFGDDIIDEEGETAMDALKQLGNTISFGAGNVIEAAKKNYNEWYK